MKTLLLLFISIIILFSCKKDVNISDAPSITPTPSAVTPGGTTMEWKQINQSIATGADVKLSFNNAAVSFRDDRQNLHLVYQDGSFIKYGIRNILSGTWSFQSLSKLAAGTSVSKATIGTTGAGNIYICWSENSSPINNSIAIIRSDDYGLTWTTPFAVRSGNFETPISMYVFTRSNNTPGIVLTWYDITQSKCFSTTWRGNIWMTSDWTAPIQLSSGTGTSHDASVNGYGENIFAAWEDDRSGQKEIYIRKSADGGITWGSEMAATSGGIIIRGQDPSLALNAAGVLQLVYQNQNRIHYTSRNITASDFNAPINLADGIFAHLAVNTQGMVAISWEHFIGNLFDDSGKTVGLSISANNMQTFDAPHALPNSATVYYSIQSAVSMSARFADLFWIDVSDAANKKVKYAYAEIR